MIFPAQLAGKVVRISNHMVMSPILLLWSKPSMVRAWGLLDLPEDRVKICSSWTALDITSAGHHSLPILPQKEVTKHSLAALQENEGKEAVLASSIGSLATPGRRP